ncbi:hypothetical protein [Streptomyces sp. NPDC048636]|uniref:hypothetical protein n=1 Tax=Streptomyces sp. NPDC048636 TaxID=3155762 RepID=UPI0034140C6A
METWTSEEHTLFQDLLSAAHGQRRPSSRSLRRIKILALVAYAMPLYVADELISIVRGSYWDRLTRHVDRVDSRYVTVSRGCLRAGDYRFVARVEVVAEELVEAMYQVRRRLDRR